jgi:hypothetical protein
MRSSWKALAAIAVGLFVSPQLAVADDVQDQLKKMQERMSQLEDRLQSTTDQLSVTEQRAAEQQQLLERSGVAAAKGSQSALDSFFDTLEFGGYVDATYNYNINHLDGGNTPFQTRLSGGNGLYSSLTDSTGFNLEAVKFELERPVSVENRGGFRVDLFLGEQARLLNSLGTGANVLSNSSATQNPTTTAQDVCALIGQAGNPNCISDPQIEEISEFASARSGIRTFDLSTDTKSNSQIHVSQAYAQYLMPLGDIKFKMGAFYTLLGAEVVESPYNYNITRSILFYNLPIEHIGALAEKKYDNGLMWALGVVNGWDRDNGADFNKSKTLLGRFGWGGESYSAIGNLIYGAEQPGNEGNKRGVFDLVFTANPIEALSMYLQFDLGWEDFKDSFPNQKSPFFWGVAWAGRYAITDRLGLSLRAEWYNDDRSGFFCTQGSVQPGNNTVACAGTGINAASSAYEVTTTLDYALTSQLTARAEFRSDWVNNQYNSDDFFRSSVNRNLQSNQQTLAAQLYYRF